MNGIILSLIRLVPKLDQINMKKNNNGYAALASVLVIAAVVLTIGTTVPILGVGEIQNALLGKKNEEVLNIVEACAEDALLRVNENNSVAASFTLPQATCAVAVNSHVGDNWDITVSTTKENITKSVQITFTRTTTVAVTSWKEI